MDFALKSALDTSVFTALSKAIFHKGKAPARQGKRLLDGTVR